MSTAQMWMARLPHRPNGTLATATVHDLDGGPASWLAAWTAQTRPHPDASRVDAAVIDPHGPAAAVSWVWPEPTARPLFDDPSVVHAIRRLSWVPHLKAVTTLTVDPIHFAGSLLSTDPATAAAWPGWWSMDPFARLGPRRRMLVEAGLLSNRVAVLGPGTQRRAGAPWPSTW